MSETKLFREKTKYLRTDKRISYVKQGDRLGIDENTYANYRLRSKNIPHNIIEKFNREFSRELESFEKDYLPKQEELLFSIIGRKDFDIEKLIGLMSKTFKRIVNDLDQKEVEEMKDLIGEFNELMLDMGKKDSLIQETEEKEE